MSTWEGWNEVEESIHILCLVALVLGLQDCRENSWEKDSVGLLEGYPGETSCFPILTSTHFANSLRGYSLQGRICHALTAVILSSVAFLSGPSAGLLGSSLCLCWLSAELLCREVTWHRAATWTWRVEGRLELLVEAFFPGSLSFSYEAASEKPCLGALLRICISISASGSSAFQGLH